MGITGTIGTVIIGIIVLLIMIIAIAVFLVKVLAQVFVDLIILTVGVDVGFWLYGKMKTRI